MERTVCAIEPLERASTQSDARRHDLGSDVFKSRESSTLVKVSDGATLPSPGPNSLFKGGVIQFALISLLTKKRVGLKFGGVKAITECATAGAFSCHFGIQRSA